MSHFTSMPATIRTNLNAAPDLLYIAHQQRLACPILPPTSETAQRKLFDFFRTFSSAPPSASIVNFCRDWNSSVNGKDTFYLTTELVKLHSAKWEKIRNQKETARKNRDAQQALRVSIRESDPPQNIYPPAAERSAIFHPPGAAPLQQSMFNPASVPLVRVPPSATCGEPSKTKRRVRKHTSGSEEGSSPSTNHEVPTASYAPISGLHPK